ncbi:MAG: hypothetical protein ACOX4I_01595 [Anaerovoracaceae bacterium]
MIMSESIILIREIARAGKSPYAIAKELGHSKNTVKKYLQPGSTEKSVYPTHGSNLDPFKPKINEMMESGIFNCVTILENIKAIGYDGSISILKDYVHPFDRRSKFRQSGVMKPFPASRHRWIGVFVNMLMNTGSVTKFINMQQKRDTYVPLGCASA